MVWWISTNCTHKLKIPPQKKKKKKKKAILNSSWYNLRNPNSSHGGAHLPSQHSGG
jgi:hypothetical protein